MLIKLLLMPLWTHYDNLKVPRNATFDEIKSSYRKLVFMHHPDRADEKDREKKNRILQIINHSYSVLSDPVRRHAYDMWLMNEEKYFQNKEQSQEKKESQKQENSQNNYQREEELREITRIAIHEIALLIKIKIIQALKWILIFAGSFFIIFLGMLLSL